MSKTKAALTAPIYAPRNWGKPTLNPRALPTPWYGLDTERDVWPKNTGRFVCGWIHDMRKSTRFQSLWDLQPGTYFVWNLQYDIEGLVRDVGSDDGWQMREDGTAFELDGKKCINFHGKRFEWRDGTGRRLFIEASSFFNRIGLKEAAKQINDMKGDVDASKMSLARYQRERKYKADVDKYCAHDAYLAIALIVKLNKGLEELGVVLGGTPGATARRFLKEVPNFPKVIWNTHLPFLRGYCGGRFEVDKRGVFPRADKADLVSAYPWALSNCPMLTDKAFARRTQRVSDSALYGVYQIKADTDEYLGVFPCWKGSTRVFSKAENKAWLCKPEIDWLQRRGHDFKIFQGVEIFDENATDGWRELIAPIFAKKKYSPPGSPIQLGAKVGINSVYGILIQLIEKGGKWVPIEDAMDAVDFAGKWALEKGTKAFEGGQFYAPCYASTLTSMVRVRVLDASIEAGLDNVVAAHTDSLLLCGGRIAMGENLGDWKMEKRHKELVILKSGQYAHGDEVKGRGFAKRSIDGGPMQRQRVDLWAHEHTRQSRTGIKQATDWRDVSVIKRKQVANNFEWDIKRKWPRAYSSRMVARGEWLDSEALRNVKK